MACSGTALLLLKIQDNQENSSYAHEEACRNKNVSLKITKKTFIYQTKRHQNWALSDVTYREKLEVAYSFFRKL
jgi:hypothetical protein